MYGPCSKPTVWPRALSSVPVARMLASAPPNAPHLSWTKRILIDCVTSTTINLRYAAFPKSGVKTLRQRGTSTQSDPFVEETPSAFDGDAYFACQKTPVSNALRSKRPVERSKMGLRRELVSKIFSLEFALEGGMSAFNKKTIAKGDAPPSDE